MEENNEFYRIQKILSIRYPRFATQIANVNFAYKSDLSFHTAGTDGKTIFFDPNYLESLTDDEKLFVVAHEIMHIKFKHMESIRDKNGQLRDAELWNIATDAIINANLEQDGFEIKKGYVNIPEAINYNAEQLYTKLLIEKQTKQNELEKEINYDKQSKNNNDLSYQPFKQKTNCKDITLYNPTVTDYHGFWSEPTIKKSNFIKNKLKSYFNESNNTISEENYFEINEMTEFIINRELRQKKAKEYYSKQVCLTSNFIASESFKFVAEDKPVVNWKILLKSILEKQEELVWSQRKAVAENNYAYRLIDETEEEIETEVMLDVSSSISTQELKSFLQQLKPLLKNSKLKVGFFAGNATKDFIEIKKDIDIDNITIPKMCDGTNFDLAVRAFSHKTDINKVVFTDGLGKMPEKDLSKTNVIWIVYNNDNFNPCCGKVLNVKKSYFTSNEQELIKK